MVQKPDGLRGERVWKRCKGGPWKDAGRMPGCVPFCMQACAQLHVARREHSTYLNTAATGLEMEEARLRWNVLHLAHCPGNRLQPAKHALTAPLKFLRALPHSTCCEPTHGQSRTISLCFCAVSHLRLRVARLGLCSLQF